MLALKGMIEKKRIEEKKIATDQRTAAGQHIFLINTSEGKNTCHDSHSIFVLYLVFVIFVLTDAGFFQVKRNDDARKREIERSECWCKLLSHQMGRGHSQNFSYTLI